MTEENILPTIAFETMDAFETWLDTHHDNTRGIWLKLFKKGTDIQTITYAEALDVALCYGWIDSQKKTFDEVAWVQKFCPRTPKSTWSKINVGHVERLLKGNRMKPAGLKAVELAKADGRWAKAYEPPSKMTLPEDFLLELSKNKNAETFFKTLNKTNLFAIGFRLHSAKRPETRIKRMKDIIEKLAKSEKFY